MTTVMCFGTFDLLHPGHKHFFRQAIKHGDKLVVIIGRDTNVQSIKSKSPVWNEDKRRIEVQKFIQTLPGIAELGDLKDFYIPIEKHTPDIIALGYDQTVKEGSLRKELKARELEAKVIRLKAHKPEEFKSSLMK